MVGREYLVYNKKRDGYEEKEVLIVGCGARYGGCVDGAGCGCDIKYQIYIEF
jgi:hypothetical protein